MVTGRKRPRAHGSNITSYFSDTDSVEIVHDVSNAGGKLAGDAFLGGGAVRVIRSGSKLVPDKTALRQTGGGSGYIDPADKSTMRFGQVKRM